MKIKNYIALLSVAALFTACDIDTYPEGGARIGFIISIILMAQLQCGQIPIFQSRSSQI